MISDTLKKKRVVSVIAVIAGTFTTATTLFGCKGKTDSASGSAPSSQQTGKSLGQTKNVPNSFQRSGAAQAPASAPQAARSAGASNLSQ